MKDTLEIINELLADLDKTPAKDRSTYYGGVIGALHAARDNAQWELERLSRPTPPAPTAAPAAGQ